jgi:hypothetical protein
MEAEHPEGYRLYKWEASADEGLHTLFADYEQGLIVYGHCS